MKKLIAACAFAVFLVNLLLIFRIDVVFAATECNLASFAPGTRDLTTCVGGFTSESDLRNITVQIECLANSNADPNSLTAPVAACRSIQNPSYILPTTQILRDGRGLYYSCSTAQGINRAIGLINVNFLNSSGTKMCSVSRIATKPSNWNAFTEGAYWNTGTNQPSQLPIFCNSDKGVQTAIGCISTDPAGFIGTFLKFGVGIAGGIAFLLILFGGFQIITSAGNPEQLNAGKELISSAIAGLLLIIFSILLLKIIGYNILGIPDFG